MSPTRILIVDDEPKVVRLLRTILSSTGFEVMVSHNAEHAISQLALEQPDLVLLDIMFPGEMDGYEVCRKIREFSDVPVIILTAKVRDADKLRGFDAGADDYITKPFNSKELVARVRALVKRSRSPLPADNTSQVSVGNLKVNLASRRVWVGECEVHLTPIEFNLLAELVRHRDQVLTHEQLLTSVWGQEHRYDQEYLRAFIYTLRKKIEENPSQPSLIVRCSGVGYSLVTPVP